MSESEFFTVPQVNEERARNGKLYGEFLRVPAMSAGLYVLAAGATDAQSLHGEDEMYYVVRGKGRMLAGGKDEAVAAGSVIFVGANAEHRFYDISEELVLLVFFAPAESS